MQTITVPTIDLSEIVAEVEWLQGDEPMAFEAMEAIERQAPAAYWDEEDEDAETTLTLTDDQYTIAKPIIDRIVHGVGIER